MDEACIHGEWMGFLRIAHARRAECAAIVRALILEDSRASMTDLLNTLVRTAGPVRVVYSTGNWLDIDSLADVVVELLRPHLDVVRSVRPGPGGADPGDG